MSSLIRYEAARSALAAAHQIDEVKDIRDKAEAMAAYARQAKDSELIQYATEIKVRAERRCGEMLASAERARPEENLRRGPKSNDTTSGPTLAEMGLTKDESSRYQKLAAMPAAQFEVAVKTAKAAVGQVTTAHLLREAKKAAVETTKPTVATPSSAPALGPVTVLTPAASPKFSPAPSLALSPAPTSEPAAADLQRKYDELVERFNQVAADLESTIADNSKMGAVFDADDHLQAAMERIKQLEAENATQRTRIAGLQSEKNEVIRSAQFWKRRAEGRESRNEPKPRKVSTAQGLSAKVPQAQAFA